jgi:uncharacterized protein YqgV (UPF0045/DUF77 family)
MSVKDLVKDVVASPLGDVIASVGAGVAEAQQALDEAALAKTLEIYATEGDAALQLLREVGYRPTFYALPETSGEVKVSLQLGNATQANTAPNTTTQQLKTLRPDIGVKLSRMGINTSPKPRLYASMVDGGYANRYSYQANVSAKISFKIVPVPPPDGSDELRYAPSIIDRSVTEAAELLQQAGFNLIVQDSEGNTLAEPDGNLLIKTQEPEPNRITTLGTDILAKL